jgi:hypothetical protein
LCEADLNTTLELVAADVEAFLDAALGNNLTLKTNDSGGAGDDINISTALDTTNPHGNTLTFDADDVITGFANLVGANYTAILKVALTGPVSKVYDATTVATLGTANYFVHGNFDTDTITVIETVGAYTSKDVADNGGAGEVTASLTGADFSGATATYTFPATATGNVGTITAKTLAYTGLTVPASKIYDATTSAVVSGTPTLNAAQAPGSGTTVDGNPYTGDTVNITGTAVGTYDTKDVATAKQPRSRPRP